MLHRLEDSALIEARLVGQFHRIEDSSGRNTGTADQRHRFFFGVLTGPLGDDLVDLGLALDSGGGLVVARIADQLLSPDQF